MRRRKAAHSRIKIAIFFDVAMFDEASVWNNPTRNGRSPPPTAGPAPSSSPASSIGSLSFWHLNTFRVSRVFASSTNFNRLEMIGLDLPERFGDRIFCLAFAFFSGGRFSKVKSSVPFLIKG